LKVYFDTNVLIAALITEHPHHTDSFAALLRVHRAKINGYIAAHGLAELYSVLTRAPFTSPVHPEDALRLITESIAPFFHIVNVSAKGYLAVIETCGVAGWKGGRIHDALHLQAARQSACDLIYTYNLLDFQGLAPDLAGRIQNPDPATTSSKQPHRR
jgi:predicted nucleic acid-binding protein